MNSNLIRTLLTWGAIVVTFATTILGCSADAITGVTSCSASWLPPQWAGMIATGFLILNQLLKAFQGGMPGSGLVAPTVVVSPSGAAGTVTQKQVETDTSGAKK